MNNACTLTKKLYFTTDTVVEWVDIFTRPVYKHIIIDSLTYCQKEKGLIIYAWVLMSNHLHMIIGSDNDNISDIIRDFKKFSSKSILNEIRENRQESRSNWMLHLFKEAIKEGKKNAQYKFWQNGNDAQLIYSNDFLIQKLNYIHNNPVKAEFVNMPEDFKYSSAIDYAGGKGLLDVTLLSLI